ncbi:MFS transporter [Corynebacterium sp. Marseille-Q2516]
MSTELSPHAPFPYLKLTGLSFAAFIAIMTENVPSGLLLDMALSFGTSTAVVGQFLTAYAFGSVVAAIPVMTVTRAMPRRALLVTAVGFLAAFNALTAMTTVVGVGFVSRFIAGMAGGVVWGLVANYARSLVTPDKAGRALAWVSFGQPIALAFGVPLGAWASQFLGWRGVFVALSAIAAGLAIWIGVTVPPRRGMTGGAPGLKLLAGVLRVRGVPAVLVALAGWICAHNIVYTYIAPVTRDAGAPVSVDAVLLAFGVAASVGIFAPAAVVDAPLYAAAVACGAALICGLGLICVAAGSPWGLIGGVIVWGVGFGGAPTVMQTALAARAGEQADMAQSFFVTVFNSGVGLGGAVGGVLSGAYGSGSLPWVAAGLCVGVGVLLWWRPAYFSPAGVVLGGQAQRG